LNFIYGTRSLRIPSSTRVLDEANPAERFIECSPDVVIANSSKNPTPQTSVATQALFKLAFSVQAEVVTHKKLVAMAVAWLRRYRCGVVLSEQACVSGEMPDAIGWKKACHSVLVECKVTRGDFLVDRAKPWRRDPQSGVGSERYYFAPEGMIELGELPAGWGLLELAGREIEVKRRSAKNLRSPAGFECEMNLLLASLRRVELRIEPQSITDFLKWKNRMAEYNRGTLPEGLTPAGREANGFLEALGSD
jgi:hypothetical protein